MRAVGSLGKTCYVYMLDRETGEPINPIVETAVPVNTDVPGEEVWPTQPVPYTCWFAVAMSGLPSPSKSPIAAELGADPAP